MPDNFKRKKTQKNQQIIRQEDGFGRLAPYACHPSDSRGRRYKEQEGRGRSVFQRDRDRIIHSTAFRRLEYKTQVFVNHEGDHYRTRLTHSLEVAQLARSAARELNLNEDLSEALALAHDLGHPPFGHAGESALGECMKKFGGFNHNAQSVRILTKLEQKYAEFDGLNLTWECLEGLVKHNGPLDKRSLPRGIAEYNKQHDLELDKYPSAEAQIASLCDDIAYNTHDIEDGLRAGLFEVDDIIELPFVGEIFRSVMKKYPDINEHRLIHESKRRLINAMSSDLVSQTMEQLNSHKIKSADDIRSLGKPVAFFSEEMRRNNISTKQFLTERMYKHYKVNRMTSKARKLVTQLFGIFHNEPECLPTEWRKIAGKPGTAKTAEVVADFIAGMTDRFANEEHKRVFDLSYKIIGDYTN